MTRPNLALARFHNLVELHQESKANYTQQQCLLLSSFDVAVTGAPSK